MYQVELKAKLAGPYNDGTILRMAQPETHFRTAILLFAGVSAMLGLWISAAQIADTDVGELPTNFESAAAASLHRDRARLAGSLGIIRGDLWAQSAFTYADLFWTNSAVSSSGSSLGENRSAHEARRSIEKALTLSPHRTDVWLILAAISLRMNWQNLDPASALKMSFYTGPNETSYIPMRLLVAAQSSLLGDADIQQFVRRDIRLILLRIPEGRTVVQTVYRAANSTNKQFIEGVVKEIDPAFVELLRAALSR